MGTGRRSPQSPAGTELRSPGKNQLKQLGAQLNLSVRAIIPAASSPPHPRGGAVPHGNRRRKWQEHQNRQQKSHQKP